MIIDIAAIIVVLFFAIILHECAHGWIAYQLGDPTAKQAGRLTLNPFKHVDPFGTLLLPGILLTLRFLGLNTFVFGWAKPVPVSFSRLRNPKRDMIWVGLAGPAMNIGLAVIFSLLLRLNTERSLTEILEFAVFINLLLAVFNLIPIPPLDGSRLVMGLLPNRYFLSYSRLERYGLLIVILLLYVGLFEHILFPIISFLGQLLGVRFS
ncbi:MAG: site-2 protease family protein [Candidatus Omnitrophica bacterium]|nr:site-2 protease family protein [Candidatus Omnitrophota bacterium]